MWKLFQHIQKFTKKLIFLIESQISFQLFLDLKTHKIKEKGNNKPSMG